VNARRADEAGRRYLAPLLSFLPAFVRSVPRRESCAGAPGADDAVVTLGPTRLRIVPTSRPLILSSSSLSLRSSRSSAIPSRVG
jgi:hypothetical protein